VQLKGYWEWRGSTYLTKNHGADWVPPKLKVLKQTSDTDVCEAFQVRLRYFTDTTPKYVKLKIFEQTGDWLETSLWKVH
jgi:hypothetical protein